MKLSKLKPGTPIEVIWKDACTHENGEWINESGLTLRTGGVKIISVGIFIQKKGGCIRMSGDRHTSERYKPRSARCFDVPVGTILSMRKLK